MVEAQRFRIEQEVTNLVNELDKSYLRRMQGDMHRCAAKCCDDPQSSLERVHGCIDNCTATLNQANNYVQISEAAVKRKAKKIRKCNYSSAPAPPCVCKNPVLEVVNCACRSPIIESTLAALAPFDIGLPGFQSPVIEIPNYRSVEPIALNPLKCLFPSIDIPNYDILAAPIAQPTVEYYSTVDLPCGCPGPKCGCRSPIKLPPYEEFVTTIDVPSCGYQNLQISGVPSYSYTTSIIEIPSYGPAPVIQIPGSCFKTVTSPCGCQGPCSCSGYPTPSCGCQEPCSCAEYQILSCGCQGSCPSTRLSACGCQGPCSCSGIPKSCGCQESCSCSGYPLAPCGCQEPCNCAELQNPWLYPGTQVSTCGCQGPCGCAGIPKSCGCQGSCGCSGIQATVALLPTMEGQSCGCQGPCQCPGTIDICGCGCGIPGCNCGQSIRQLTLQPPFL